MDSQMLSDIQELADSDLVMVMTNMKNFVQLSRRVDQQAGRQIFHDYNILSGAGLDNIIDII
jgi:hypothetical protein